MLEGYFLVCRIYSDSRLRISVIYDLGVLQAIYAVVVWRKSTMPVILSISRLVSGQRASLETVPPPRDRLSLGGQSELISWWFVPDHIHGTSSSILLLR